MLSNDLAAATRQERSNGIVLPQSLRGPPESDTVSKARAKLRRDTVQWRSYQFEHYPKLRDHILLVNFGRPADESLRLPPAFTPAMRAGGGRQ